MTLRVWDPFRDVLSLRDAMNQLFEDSVVQPASSWYGNGVYTPADLVETEDGYTLRMALPGFSPENVDVNITGDVLTIHAEHKGEQTEGITYLLRERPFGTIDRAFRLPMPVQVDQVHAQYINGELILTLPKAEEVRPRQIKIEAGSQQQLGSGTESSKQQVAA